MISINLESRERLILEISIAVIFLAFLICGSIIIVQASGGSEIETTITNSFNTYNFYSQDGNSRFRTYQDYNFYGDDYDGEESEKRYLRYDAHARVVSSKGILGNDIKKYEVTVRNRDYVGGSFKVIFHFKDYEGETESYAITHYIDARDKKVFSFKDISPSKYKYSRWWYEVKSLTEIKDRY